MKADAVVVDTKVPISARLLKDSVPARLLEALRERGALLLFSAATYNELSSRLRRPKFRKYVQPEEIDAFLTGLADVAEVIEPGLTVSACRDASDNKLLELALAGDADCLISGDRDLLLLNPYEGCPILSPAEFLALIQAT